IGSAEKVTRSPVKEGYMEARFTIMKRLKGFDEILGDKVFVFTPDKPENCGYPFSPGQDYVVFAQGNPAGLRTTSCLGTVYLDNVTGEIDSLLKLSDAAASASRATVTLSPAPGAPKITATPRTPPTPKTDSPPLLDLGDE
ncbi:MAG: hypothetical protein IT290_04340, partial [Deltaproteobacteria bacterium]|nr:hypothetical protein [Deltaproteobacteria bacterium]